MHGPRISRLLRLIRAGDRPGIAVTAQDRNLDHGLALAARGRNQAIVRVLRQYPSVALRNQAWGASAVHSLHSKDSVAKAVCSISTEARYRKSTVVAQVGARACIQVAVGRLGQAPDQRARRRVKWVCRL